MTASDFEYFAPTDVVEALDLMHTKGGGARPLAGGMTLVPLMCTGMQHPAVVVSLNRVAGLDGIEEFGAVVRVGAMCRHAAIACDPLLRRDVPLFARAAASIGDIQVRNRGTLGGSIAHGDPAADYPSALVALGATILVQSVDGERRVPADEFFVGMMTTNLAPDELVVAVEVPKCAGLGYAHERQPRATGDFPIVLASVQLLPDGAGRLVLGGIRATPVVLDFVVPSTTTASVAALGRRAFDAAAGTFGDLNGSPEYRRAMARVLSERALRAAQ